LCVNACHEGAIGMVNGKAKLLRDDYCDGLGDCLPVCPTGAITFEEREAAEYNEAAVQENKLKKQKEDLPCGCPGTQMKLSTGKMNTKPSLRRLTRHEPAFPVACSNQTCTGQCAVFENANLLIAADCTAYAYGNFHNKFMKNRITLIGCPKLDDVDYTEKLTAIIKNNNIKSVTVVRMEFHAAEELKTR